MLVVASFGLACSLTLLQSIFVTTDRVCVARKSRFLSAPTVALYIPCRPTSLAMRAAYSIDWPTYVIGIVMLDTHTRYYLLGQGSFDPGTKPLTSL